jgi:hypothetical protein
VKNLRATQIISTKSLTSSQQNKTGVLGSTMTEEYIVIMEKIMGCFRHGWKINVKA